MQNTYTKAFKEAVVKKVLSKEKTTTVISIAKDCNIAISTLYKWMAALEAKNTPLSREGNLEKKPCQWSFEERFQALLDTASMNDEEQSKYCRNKGIFPHHLSDWKSEILQKCHEPNNGSKSDLRALKSELKTLNAEIHRKDKALAEAAALLVLKKKADQFWSEKEEF